MDFYNKHIAKGNHINAETHKAGSSRSPVPAVPDNEVQPSIPTKETLKDVII